MPITYKKDISGDIGDKLIYGNDDMLLYTINGAKYLSKLMKLYKISNS